MLPFTTGCTRSGGDYICYVGEPVITLPSSLDPITGTRSLDIQRFTLHCELERFVNPPPRYTWTKDGIVVARNFTRPNSGMEPLDDDFLMAGNNSLLILLGPRLPIMIDGSLRLRANLALSGGFWNFTSVLTLFSEGTTVEDLRRLVLEAVLGNWTCTAHNAFGSDTASSFVTSKEVDD